MVVVSGRVPPAEGLGSHDDVGALARRCACLGSGMCSSAFARPVRPVQPPPPGCRSTARAELAAELEPVFALLVETERECADILDRARLEEAGSAPATPNEPEAIVAAGRARVEAERAAAAARSRGRGEAVPTGAADAHAGPSGGGGTADDALDHHVDLVVDAVRSLLGHGTRSDDHLAGAR